MYFLPIRLLPVIVVLLMNLLPPIAAAESGKPNASDRCPVCGMFVAPHSNWLSVVTFADGQEVFFDGPKDLFRYIFDLQTYQAERTLAEIQQVRVTEYYSTRLMDAKEVFFVTGSDVLGPMGAELVPVFGKGNAEAFLKDHAGKAVMQFDGKELNKVVSGD
jgi:copper chaperone NosL